MSAFGSTGQSSFSGTSSVGTAPSSFGSSPFGAMPASAFTLGSRSSATSNPQSTFGATPSAFGTTTSTNTFGQPRPAFGATTSTPSTFGSGTSSAFGVKPSAFGNTSSLPPAPLSSGLSSQPTFGQTSTLGIGSLPPPPGTGFGSKPTFGQPSALGVLGGNAPPAFGQASSFSSPFASGLGQSLGGGTTFGAKSTFGSFGQNNQPNAFAQAAGTGQQNAFMQGTNQLSAFANLATSAANDRNRFTLLSESNESTTAAGDKDDDMADELSPVQEKVSTVGLQASSVPSTSAPTPPPAVTVTPVATVAVPPPAAPAAPVLTTQLGSTSTLGLSNAFGSLSTQSGKQPQSQTPSIIPPKPAEATVKPVQSTNIPAKPTPSRSLSAGEKPVIDEMAAWRANEFVIGGIPETEPPLEVR
jgi:nucleoporin NUP159